jgi:hypothetical protein
MYPWLQLTPLIPTAIIHNSRLGLWLALLAGMVRFWWGYSGMFSGASSGFLMWLGFGIHTCF